jgi:hypothetical protein
MTSTRIGERIGARIDAHVLRPRSYCSDATCGGTDCTTCYGPSAEVFVEIVIDGQRIDDRDLAELDDADDEAPFLRDVTIGDVRAAIMRALDPTPRSTWAPTSADAPFIDDDLPF